MTCTALTVGRVLLIPLVYEKTPALLTSLFSNFPLLFCFLIYLAECVITPQHHLAAPCCLFYARRYRIYWRIDTDHMVLASVVSWYPTKTNTHTHTGQTKHLTIRTIHTYKYILTPPVMCAQQLPVLNWINDVLIQRFTLQRSTMCFLFRNYSLVEAIHLLIRFKKTNSFLWNIKNTVRNGINGHNRHHTQREKITLERLFSFI